MKRACYLTVTLLLISGANAFGQVDAYVQMDFEGPVQLVVTDSQGNRCGYNPITNTNYNEIPYAGYGFGSVGNTKEFGFNTALMDTSFSTTYAIRVIGTGPGTFIGDGGGRQTWSGKGGDFHVVGVVDSNQAVIYRFSYSTDSTITPTLTKVVTPRILRQDFRDCFKLKRLGDREFYREASLQLDIFERHLDRRDSLEARRELENLRKRLQKVYADTLGSVYEQGKGHESSGKFERRHRDFVTQEAYQILSEDISLMLERLPVKQDGRREEGGRRKG